jgi:hemolysin activation/secretion protein
MGATGNGRLLSGFGFGINWSHKANLSVRAFAAWRTGGAPTSDADRLPRVWVQLVQGF